MHNRRTRIAIVVTEWRVRDVRPRFERQCVKLTMERVKLTMEMCVE